MYISSVEILRKGTVSAVFQEYILKSFSYCINYLLVQIVVKSLFLPTVW